jgi:hypothetical protein
MKRDLFITFLLAAAALAFLVLGLIVLIQIQNLIVSIPVSAMLFLLCYHACIELQAWIYWADNPIIDLSPGEDALDFYTRELSEIETEYD